ncbi:hypothetical protein [Parasitella parasitica]|uniref:Reverse transcriptase domain-containing protein n=1 Tax=Parasitella parasitica TaxID=35722 RepID=A0A0B7NC28_9FUNG|nr:hypothetical protein [Parasitella parasitica]
MLIDVLLKKYHRLVEKEEQQTLTSVPYTHSLDTGTAQLVVTRNYRRSSSENAAIQQEVEVMLQNRVIVPSNREWCSPVVLIKKLDGTYRFCADDYRKLYKITVKDTHHPLRLISDLLDQPQGYYNWFSTCDLKSGFWQPPLKQDDGSAKKTAF